VRQARRILRDRLRELKIPDAVHQFHSEHYLRHTARRLEHLASLGLPLSGRTVFEMGAGAGDLSQFYVDRGCTVTLTDVRPVLIKHLRKRFPEARVELLDMENPHAVGVHDIVHSYGLLYHLGKPAEAIAFMAESCGDILLLETCVSFGSEPLVNLVEEPSAVATQAHSGRGCRPTRSWVRNELLKHFPHVYVTRTQPVHEEFPIDWTKPEEAESYLHRLVFVASRNPLDLPTLIEGLPDQQERQP
jgi:hypothetical protein